MNKKYVLLLVVGCACVMSISASELKISKDAEKNDIRIIENDSLRENKKFNWADEEDWIKENDWIIAYENKYDEDVNEDSQPILDQYSSRFSQKWSEKELTLDQVQHTTLGFKWFNPGVRIPMLAVTPYTTLQHFIGSTTEGIDATRNASILRIIACLVTEPLEKGDLGDSALESIKNTLKLCQAHQIHKWTSPHIGKEVMDKRSRGESVTDIKKNTVKQAFKKARARLFEQIKDHIKDFAGRVDAKVINMAKVDDQKVVIPTNLINKFKVFYALADMARAIHHELFLTYEQCFASLKIDETDIIRHVLPTSLSFIQLIKEKLESIKLSASEIENAKLTLLNAREMSEKIKIEESTIVN